MSNRVENGNGLELVRTVILGLVAATTVVVGGSLAGAAEAGGPSTIWSVPTVPVRLSFPLLPALVIFYGGMVLLVRSWLLLRRFHLRVGLPPRAFMIVLSIWLVPFLIGPPLGSRDVYAYGAQGRAVELGFDMYEAGPAVLGEQDPVLAPVDPVYYDAPAVYGPAFVELSKGVASVAGDGVVTSVILFRIIALLSVGLSALALYHIARRLNRDPVDALIIGVANPLTALHLVSGAHNESIMLALMLGGIAVGMLPRLRLVGIGLCVLAATIKLPALLAAAFLAMPWVMETSSWPARIYRASSASIVVAGGFALVGELTGFGWNWVGALFEANTVDAYLSITTVAGVAVSWLTGVDVDLILTVTRSVGYLAAIGTVLVLLFKRYSSWPEALAWSLFVAALLHPTTQPWYLTWSVGLLAAVYGGNRNRVLTVVLAVAAFSVMPSGPQLGYLLTDRASTASILFGVLLIGLLTLSPRTSFQKSRLEHYGSFSTPPRLTREDDLVSVIVPVEADSDRLCELQANIDAVLTHRRYELVIVDDSIDAVVLRSDASPGAVNVRVLNRGVVGSWGGTGGAVSDGLSAAAGGLAVVIDRDLQDEAETVLNLLEELDSGSDIAIASRRLYRTTSDDDRQPLSMAGLFLSRVLFPKPTRSVTDPLSGFFAVRLDRVADELHPDGPKLLLELLVTHPDLVCSEVHRPDVGRCRIEQRLSLTQRLQILGHMFELWLRTSRLWAGSPITQRVFASYDRRASEKMVPL